MKEKLEQIGKQILEVTKNELYVYMRFMDVALSSFEYEVDSSAERFGTDGFTIFYNPMYISELYRENRLFMNRAYFHLVMHCILRHMAKPAKRSDEYMNLAYDIVVESIADNMNVRPLKTSRSWLRRETYRQLEKELKVLTPKGVCKVLKGWKLSEQEKEELVREFIIDDHSYWIAGNNPARQQQANDKWQNISEHMETDMDTFGQDSSGQSESLLEQMKIENRDRHDYRQFLRKFMVWREEMKVDMDSFDYGMYSYGMELYENMPLIEPQEWSEVRKVEELVIVIDTSMSCSGELVKRFLEETYDVLSESESFFRDIHIHIIQCDDKVQAEQRITSGDELQEYMAELEVKGQGGTDFRPAFAHVDEMINKKAFYHLKGLLYFTDGRGVYPAKMPAYETAFIFMADDYEDKDVPPWAIKLILDEETLIENDRG